MPDLFTAKLLDRPQIDQAYPVVQSVLPNLRVEDWRQQADKLIDAPDAQSGIMTVQHRDYIHGLFCFRTERGLQHARVLIAETFIVLDLFNAAAAVRALIAAMDRLAEELGCDAIQASLPAGEICTPDYRRWVLEQLGQLDQRVHSVILLKSPGQAPALPANQDSKAAAGDARQTWLI